MNHYTKYFLFPIFLLAISFASFAQDYNINQYNNQTITTCSGNFFDSGGEYGTYSPNESYTVTFCPQTAGTFISLDFSSWEVSAGASLAMHDGPNTSSWLGATFSSPGFNPTTMDVGATVTNTSGCLTLVWAAGSGYDDGWIAAVSCIIPCQTVMSDLTSSFPMFNDSGYIDICVNQNVTFYGTGVFPQNNIIYGQSNNTSSFVWNFGDGSPSDSSGINFISHVYDSIAGYNVSLTVYDSMGCRSTNQLGIRIRVGTEPTFAGTHISDPEICYGDTVELIGIVNPTTMHLDASLDWAGVTFLPDGYASYTSSLTFSAFGPGQTLTNINDLIGICAVMEHSFLGDLNITITCPNGTVVTLKQFPGCGGTFLGVPIDIDTNLNPGTGWEYCWTPTPTYGNMNAECGNYSTLPSGSYATVTPITDLIGCPLNGDWTITVTDSWLSDNGYIFGWGVNFNPAILPVNFDYTPQCEVLDWDVNPTFVVDTVVNTCDMKLVIVPQVGTYDFVFSQLDDFGCTYDTTIHLLVNPTYIVNFPPDTILCSDETMLLDATNNGQNIGAQYVWHNNYNNVTPSTPNYLVDKPGTYWVDIPNIVPSCGHIDSIVVVYNDLGLDLGTDLNSQCSSSPVTINATTPLAGYPSVTYLWSTGATTASISVNSSGSYSVTVSRGECSETDTKNINFVNPLNINLGPDKFLCPGENVVLNPGFYPNATYHWSVGVIQQTLTVSVPGAYSVSVTNGCGTFKDTVLVSSINVPIIDIGSDTTICNGAGVVYLDALYNGPDPANYHWSTGAITPAIAVAYGGLYSVTVTNQCGSFVDYINITGDSQLNINLGSDSTVCPGYILDAGFQNCVYYWSTGETTQSIAINSSDGYSVEVTNTCGTYTDAVNLNVIQFNVNLGSDITICPGETTTLNAQNFGCTYLWSTGENTQMILVGNTGTYTVSVTNQCQTKVDSIIVSVFVPELNLGNDTTFCDGNTLVLDAEHPGSTYSWSNGTNLQTLNVTQAGVYSVVINNACGILYDTINVGIYPSPVVVLGPDTIQINTGQTITLDAGAGFVSYHWSTGSSTQTITVGNQGYYYVTVTDENGCVGKDKVFIEIKIGLNETQDENINIFPNPANDIIFISSEKLILQRFELYNNIGEIIANEVINANKCYIKTSQLNQGMYYIRVWSNDNKVFIKSVSIIK